MRTAQGRTLLARSKPASFSGYKTMIQHPLLTGDNILPRASLKASLCCCCCCVTLCAAALGSCSGYLSVPRDLGGKDSEGLVFTSVG